MLLADFDFPNAFEGCIEFTPYGGKPMWYPAGTRYPGQDNLKGVLTTTFKSFSWIGDDDDKLKEVVEEYR